MNPLIAQAARAKSQSRLDEAERLLRQAGRSDRDAQASLGALLAETGRREEAGAILQEVLKADPNQLSALTWMTILLMRSGRAPEATTYAERAVEASGSDPEALRLLAQSLFLEKRYAESLKYLERVLAAVPDDAAALYTTGRVLEAMTRDGDAVNAYRRAAQISPDVDGLVRLAGLCLTLGLTEEAIEHCAKALRLQPNSGRALMTQARAFIEARRTSEAEAIWSRARSSGVLEADVLLGKARALMAVGEFAAAVSEIKGCIERAPSDARAYVALFGAKKVEEGDRELVDRAVALAQRKDLRENHRIDLLFGLGKAHDNLGEYEKAIGWFDEANRLARSARFQTPFDREEMENMVEAKIRLFTKDRFTHRVGASSDLPILIAGMMRSGTTLLEQILTCHPMIGGAGEQSFWVVNEPFLLDLKGQQVQMGEMKRFGEDYLGLLASIAPGFERVIDKNPANVLTFGTIHLALPDARFIHTRRNPVDTALSIWTTPMKSDAPFVHDREAIVAAYRLYERMMDHWRSVIPNDRFLEVDYEELVANQQEMTRRIVLFCGLDWSDECLHPESNRRTVRTPSLWQVRQPMYSSSVNRWKRYEPWLGAFRELMRS